MKYSSPVAEGINCVDTYYIRSQLASIYILREKDEVAIIETGTQNTVSTVLSALAELNIKHNQVKYIIPTHIHLDHAGGAGSLMAQFDQAKLIIHPRGAKHMINPEKLIAGVVSVYGEEQFKKLYGEIKPIAENRVEVANDLDTFSLDNRALIFIDTPGHARHHFCIYDAKTRGIFSGDTFGIAYPPFKDHAFGLIPTSSPVQFDPVAMHASINRLLTYEPEAMYLTHFGALDNPAIRAVNLKSRVDEYVALCEALNPVDESLVPVLEKKMSHLISSRLQVGSDLTAKTILDLLGMDIQLNAQGLAIWWRKSQSA